MAPVSAATTASTGGTAQATTATLHGIYVARRSTAPMQSKRTARLIPGKGIDGDRYALGTGTYSARFMPEPGKQITMISHEGIVEATQRTGMRPFGTKLGEDLRRNLVVEGISASELNDMVGHEVQIGPTCRVFVHRRCVPCKLREASCQRPGLMNNLWGVSGVNCEVLTPIATTTTITTTQTKERRDDEIQVGDLVAVLPDTYQPDRIDIGRKTPGFFIRPADRTAEEVRQMITPPWIAGIACLMDPEGFSRVQDAHLSVGQRFWTSDAYAIGLLMKAVRIPLLATVAVALLAIAMGVGLHMAGFEA